MQRFFDRVEGRGAVDRPVADETCSSCQQAGGVHYLGSELLDGSLEAYHLVHTEVDDHYRCAHCGQSWVWHHTL